jgi:hypothetical protein
MRVPDMLEIPISHVLCDNTDDSGHGHSWTVVNYILQANLIEGLGGDDDPLPPDGGNPHPLPIFLLEVSGKMQTLSTT